MKKGIIIGAGIVVLGIVWALFRPELLFINEEVNEGLPGGGGAASASSAGPVRLARGEFHGVAHATKGTAAIHRLAGGERVLRLTGFETSNGPALHVYLIEAPDASDNDTVKKGFADLGALKGNVGDQNYDIPATVDLSKYNAVTIWCQRFGVNFATAPLARS